MINLPKPSPLSAKGSVNSKFDYIFNYLNQLVNELERLIGSAQNKSDSGKPSSRAICDISFKNGELILTREDGSKQSINIGE